MQDLATLSRGVFEEVFDTQLLEVAALAELLVLALAWLLLDDLQARLFLPLSALEGASALEQYVPDGWAGILLGQKLHCASLAMTVVGILAAAVVESSRCWALLVLPVWLLSVSVVVVGWECSFWSGFHETRGLLICLQLPPTLLLLWSSHLLYRCRCAKARSVAAQTALKEAEIAADPWRLGDEEADTGGVYNRF
eukprot:TRINITY_DN27331_c0_g1_i1.p1 TRINITY_DN27331_c0_g1~~TRINITY_DN27331_c0_g1_i1.p1  ORF type:complete len:196 (+),score=51.46 TRINITY_DN27331_c0_g1_i1:137-724(+)